MAHRAFKFCSNVFLQSLKASENLVLISQTTLEKPRILHFDISILPLVSKNSNPFYLLKSDHTNLIAVNRSTSLLNTSEYFGTFENLYEINNYNDSTSLSHESR